MSGDQLAGAVLQLANQTGQWVYRLIREAAVKDHFHATQGQREAREGLCAVVALQALIAHDVAIGRLVVEASRFETLKGDLRRLKNGFERIIGDFENPVKAGQGASGLCKDLEKKFHTWVGMRITSLSALGLPALSSRPPLILHPRYCPFCAEPLDPDVNGLRTTSLEVRLPPQAMHGICANILRVHERCFWCDVCGGDLNQQSPKSPAWIVFTGQCKFDAKCVKGLMGRYLVGLGTALPRATQRKGWRLALRANVDNDELPELANRFSFLPCWRRPDLALQAAGPSRLHLQPSFPETSISTRLSLRQNDLYDVASRPTNDLDLFDDATAFPYSSTHSDEPAIVGIHSRSSYSLSPSNPTTVMDAQEFTVIMTGVALAAFAPQAPDDIALDVDERIELFRVINEDTCFGRGMNSGSVGCFPIDHVLFQDADGFLRPFNEIDIEGVFEVHRQQPRAREEEDERARPDPGYSDPASHDYRVSEYREDPRGRDNWHGEEERWDLDRRFADDYPVEQFDRLAVNLPSSGSQRRASNSRRDSRAYEGESSRQEDIAITDFHPGRHRTPGFRRLLDFSLNDRIIRGTSDLPGFQYGQNARTLEWGYYERNDVRPAS